MPTQRGIFHLNFSEQEWVTGLPSSCFVFPRMAKYGDGIFETILVVDGTVQSIDIHTDRLINGIQVLGIKMGSMSSKNLLISAAKFGNSVWKSPYSRLRVQVSRGGSGAYLPDSDEAEIIAEIYPLSTNPWAEPSFADGLDVTTFHEISLSYNILSSVKSTSALPYVLASRFAKQAGKYDALLRGQDGSFAESSNSNLFIRHAATLFTPPLNSGCLPGTTRKRVMEAAIQLGIEIQERRIGTMDLEHADEVFLTNAIRGIQPLASWENVSYPQEDRIFAQQIWQAIHP